MLSSQQKNIFCNEIINAFQSLDALRTENTLQELERFENRQILREIHNCFFSSTDETLEGQLKACLSQRWERIRNSGMCYTQQPYNVVNQLCLKLAKTISPSVATPEDIKQLGPNQGPYFLLMPSLEHYQDASWDNIHELGLNEFILSDDGRAFIPIAECLYEASISDSGQFIHQLEMDREHAALTPNEIARISNHSNESTDLYRAVMELNNKRLLSDDIDSKLSQLANSLRAGGVRQGAAELNANPAANEGIVVFSEYWDDLGQIRRERILRETPDLQLVIDRLFRPNHANFQEIRYCVEMMAESLDPIINHYRRTLGVMRRLEGAVSDKKAAFENAARNGIALQINHNNKPPLSSLPTIYTLPWSEQANIFKHEDCKNALAYAVRHHAASVAPILEQLAKLPIQDRRVSLLGAVEGLQHIELAALVDGVLEQQNDALRQDFLHFLKINDGPGNGLFELHLERYAQSGNLENVCKLVDANVHVDARAGLAAIHEERCGVRRNHFVQPLYPTPLNRAAQKNHIEIVKYLCGKGASLEYRDDRSNTALLAAIQNNNLGIVEYLLEQGADIFARNWYGKNALNLAIEHSPPSVDLILKQLIKLPIERQAEFLQNVENGAYPGALHYAATKRPAFFYTLVNEVLQQPDDAPRRALLSSLSQSNNLIDRVLEQPDGALRQALLNSIITINNRLLDSHLIRHARSGNLANVRKLIDAGADVNLYDQNNNTILLSAIQNNNPEIAQHLIENNADIRTRNRGQNALGIAIEKEYHTLIESILMRMITLPMDEQMECLLDVPGGPYQNVLFYAANHEPSLFDKLVAHVLRQPDIAPQDDLFVTVNKDEENPLILAAQVGTHESVHNLLEFGLDANFQDIYGVTALHRAIIHGHRNTVTCLLDHDASLLKTRCLEGGNALDIAIEQDYPGFVESILMRIVTLPMDEQMECLLNVPGGPYPNVLLYAATENPNFLKELLHSFNNETLDSKMQHVHEHLHCISLHYQKMKTKSSHNSNYKAAASVAETFLHTFSTEILKVYQGGDDDDGNLLEFKNNCIRAIEVARPVLAQHREWGKMLAKLLLAIITLPISLPLYATGFFSTKTKSEQILNKLQTSVHDLEHRTWNIEI